MPDSPHDTLNDPFTTTLFTKSGSTHPTVTILAGVDVGHTFSLEAGDSTIGRAASATVHIPHESISRQHCQITVAADGTVTIKDLGSTNGTRLDNQTLEKRPKPLTNGARIRLSKTVALKFSFQDNLEQNAQMDLYASAVRDPLTGIHNKRFLLERLEHEVAFSARHGTPLAFLIFDLDHFKRVNDTHGHPAGDAVLIAVAQRVHNALRTEDVLARYGGEEFVVLMRGTEEEEACAVAERIRLAIASSPVLFEDLEINASASIGLAMFSPAHTADPHALIALADTRLYTAKELGRNRVVSR
jgi:diguanylate cyclase (GGDEF)-like protein